MNKASRPVKAYIAFQLFFNLLLWIPVFYQFQKLNGLSDPEIFRIQSLYYLAFCAFEVPTGWFADRFGYLASVRGGALLLAVANILAPMWPTYAGFLTHFLLIGLARSLISGAASAWAYEYLKARGEVSTYKKLEGDARFYSLVARVACWAGVGYLMTISPALPYWISAANAGIALIAALLLPAVNAGTNPAQDVLLKANAADKRESSAPQVQATVAAAPSPAAADIAAKVSVREAVRAVRRQPVLFLLMLQGVGIFVLVRIMQVNLYQPTLVGKGFDVTAFGWVMSVMTVFEAIGSKLAFRVRTLASDLVIVTMMTLGLAASVAVIGLSGKELTLLALCLFSLASGVAFPVQKQVLNDAIVDSRLRATLLSMESIVDRAVCAVAVLPLGGLVARGKLDMTLVACGLATAALAIGVQALVRRFLPATGAAPQAAVTP